MNILIICNSYPTEKNPHHHIFIKNMMEQMEAQDGVHIEVCYNRVYDFWKEANKRKDVFSNLIKYSVFIFSIIYFLVKNRKKFDVLFPQAVVFPTFFASFIKKLFDIPMVCYVHGESVNRYPGSSSFYQFLVEKAFENCDSIIVNSKDIYKRVLNISHYDDVRIISPGVDTEVMRNLNATASLRKKYNLPQDKYVLLAAGSAIRRKGFDILLEAILKLETHSLNKICLIIITEGPEREKLQDFIDTNSLNNQARIINKVDQETLNEYYNTADLFVFPTREEALGLVGIEAMAAGTLVLASDVGGIPDYLEDGKNGFLFEKENRKELTAQMSFILAQLEKKEHSLKNIYENMKPAVQAHSLKSSSQKILSLFKSLITQKDLS